MKRRGKVFFVALGCALLLIIFFPVKHNKELFFSQTWEVPLEGAASAESINENDTIIPFYSGKHFGYITSNGEIVHKEPVYYHISFANDYYINYAEISENLLVKDKRGEFLASIPSTGYPFIMNGRLFIFDKDRCGISEWDMQGSRKWKRRFSSLITAFDCSEDHVLLGFVNGEIILTKNDGSVLYRDIPTGSRIRVVYGAAMARDEEEFAVILGIDPQRLVVFSKSDNGYQPNYSETLESKYRREIFVTYSEDRNLYYEQPGFLKRLDLKRKETHSFVLAGIPSEMFFDMDNKLIIIQSYAGERGKIDIYTSGGMFLSSFHIPADTSTFLHNGKIYFTNVDRIQRVDILRGNS
jgi:hypothetical protein